MPRRSDRYSFRALQLASVTLAAYFVLCSGPAGAVQSTTASRVDATLLEPGKPLQQTVTATETHQYELKLEGGQCAAIEVEQRGIDVSVQVLADEKNTQVEVDDEIGRKGTERLGIVADGQSVYRIAVKPKWAAPGGAYEIRLVEVRPATPQDRSLYEILQLRRKARQLFDGDNDKEALPLAQRALDLAQEALGPDNAYVGVVMREVADITYNMSNPAEARLGFEHALEILKAKLGAEHPQTLFVKSRLGSVYIALGEYSKADKLLIEVLDEEEKVFGGDDPMVAGTLKTMAFMHESRGDIAKAEQEDSRGLAILERLGLTEQASYGEFLNNLGIIYQDLRQLDNAKVYLDRALAFQEKHYGQESLAVSKVLNNLGIVARQQKDYPAAEKYYERSLAIKEKQLGAEHPEYATALMNLANVYASEGDYRKSLDTHLRVLGIYEKQLSPGEFPPVMSLANVAKNYAALGDLENANRVQSRLEAALEENIALNLAIGSERQKLAYLDNVAQRTERTISLNLQLEPDSSQAASLASAVLLQRKGRVLDAMTDTLAALRKHSDPQDQALLDEFKQTSTQLARIALKGPQRQSREEYRKTLQALQEHKEKLENTISHHNEEFRVLAQVQTVSLDAVRAAVPNDTALLEFVAYRPFNPKAQTDAEQFGQPRYAAYVLQANAVAKGIDLGEASRIDATVEKLREALREPDRKDARQLAKAVAESVFQPIEPLVASDKRLLISPDGQLSLIPFEVLVTDDGRYLVEQFAITYLTTGRDLLRMQVPRPSRSAAVIVADPFFGEPKGTLLPNETQSKTAPAHGRMARRSVTTGEGFSNLYFAPLAGTRSEANSIQALFPDAQLLTGQQASEEKLAQLSGPRILHIATHGFFLQDAKQGRDAPTSRNAAGSPPEDLDNPLLRSGLALSGANLVRESKGNGILTALEVSNLDLWGTKLVTLSACDTGVGEVRNGEGVYGLRRAFFLAGAESLVMSMWPVSDYVTRELMTKYYSGLKDGLGRGEALRQAELSMLHRKGREHPFYWASFIQAGEWANLDGRR